MCCGEVRRWSHGSYTLLHDGEAARAEYALDLVLPFGCTGESTLRMLSSYLMLTIKTTKKTCIIIYNIS